MRLILIRSVIIALALAIAWVLTGRQLSLLLDRFISIRIASLPVAPLKYDGGGFLIGELPILSFTVRRSSLGWATPFEFKIMTPHSPWWKRYVYYRFIWKKRSGAKLEMLWRYEQRYYATGGWTKPEMMWNFQTGLLRVDIGPETSARENAVVQYIAKTKGWNRNQDPIESRSSNAEGRSDVIAVIYLEDERGSHPGAGQSVELWVDRTSHQVIKELGGQ